MSGLRELYRDRGDRADVEAIGAPGRLGKLEAEHRETNLSARRFMARRALAQAPRSVHWGQKVIRVGGDFPMYRNDEWGDCTTAAVGHQVAVWTANATKFRTPAEQTIERLYIPETGPDDSGRYLNDVLDYWRKTGLDDLDEIVGYGAVDVKNKQEVMAASWIFGGLYIGIGLPVTAQRQTTWHVDVSAPAADREPYSWGGHCVNVTGYATSSGVYLVTWGALMRMTWAFWNEYVDEAFAVVSKDWLDASGRTPGLAGAIDVAALQADLSSL